MVNHLIIFIQNRGMFYVSMTCFFFFFCEIELEVSGLWFLKELLLLSFLFLTRLNSKGAHNPKAQRAKGYTGFLSMKHA